MAVGKHLTNAFKYSLWTYRDNKYYLLITDSKNCVTDLIVSRMYNSYKL